MKKIKIFADGADLYSIKRLLKNKLVKGFTTNPTLMRKAGVTNYEIFSKTVAKLVYPKSVSLEVFSDDLNEMYSQAKIISSWGKNIFVKIPIINTMGLSTNRIVKKLSDEKVNLNITAIFTFKQIKDVIKVLNKNSNTILSIFAGRIADSGRDASSIIRESVNYIKSSKKNFKVLWASVREIYNLYEANNCGSGIITITPELISKIKIRNKDLDQYSIETSKMFYDDALKHKINI